MPKTGIKCTTCDPIDFVLIRAPACAMRLCTKSTTRARSAHVCICREQQTRDALDVSRVVGTGPPLAHGMNHEPLIGRKQASSFQKGAIDQPMDSIPSRCRKCMDRCGGLRLPAECDRSVIAPH